MKQESKTPKKPLIFYYLIAMLVLLLLNALVFPSLLSPRVKEVSYDQFLSLVEQKEVKQVAIEDDVILFTIKDEASKDGYAYYQTGRIQQDSDLVNRLKESGAEFSAVIPTQDSPLLNFLMTWVFPILLFVALGQSDGPDADQAHGRQRHVLRQVQRQRSTWKARPARALPTWRVRMRLRTRCGRSWTSCTILTNTRLSAQAFPRACCWWALREPVRPCLRRPLPAKPKYPFFSISGSEFVEMFVGMGAAKVRDLFKQAQEKAPCIVFIDEIDTIGKKRDSGAGIGGNDEREQTLNQLLAEMDGFDGAKGVVILAATNRPDSLDKALLRPGRFDRRVPVELPDLQGRIAILKVHAKDVKMEDNIDFDTIGRATSGASGAELANIINEAALRAVRMGRNKVAQQDLEESVEVVIAGYQRKGAMINEREKRIIAYHEIGHALVAARLKDAAPVHKITIIPRTSGALGYTMQVEEEERVLMSKEDLLNQIITLTGGRSAEEVVFNSITSGASNDIEKATSTARAMITRFGMSDSFDMMELETVNNPYLGNDTSLVCSADSAAQVDKEVCEIIRSAHQKALQILRDNRDVMDKLAAYLLEKETITGEEFMEILKQCDAQK